jgi:hypothetical protein
MRLGNDIQQSKVVLDIDPNHKSYTSDQWYSFNAANKYRREVQMPTDFDNGITFFATDLATTKLITPERVGDPRYMAETGMLLGVNKKQWIDKAKSTATMLNEKLLSIDATPEQKEAIYNYLNSVTGISHKDVIAGKYLVGTQEIPIKDYDLINWKVTPMFSSRKDIESANDSGLLDKLMEKMNITDKNLFVSKQIQAIKRIN